MHASPQAEFVAEPWGSPPLQEAGAGFNLARGAMLDHQHGSPFWVEEGARESMFIARAAQNHLACHLWHVPYVADPCFIECLGEEERGRAT